MREDQLALQLYTVRAPLEADPGGTLAAVAAMGYRNVELAGTAGLDASRFRALLDGAGLSVMGAHVGLDRLTADLLGRTLDELSVLGCSLAIVPWVGTQISRDFAGGAALAARLNSIAEVASRRGIAVGYHNHTFEFEGAPGDRLWDGLVATASPAIRFEIDVCWARVAGSDPAEVIGSLAGRVASLHLKDVDADLATPRMPGAGVLPWREILAAGDQAGAAWFVIEEDDPSEAFEAAEAGLQHIRGLASQAGIG